MSGQVKSSGFAERFGKCLELSSTRVYLLEGQTPHSPIALAPSCRSAQSISVWRLVHIWKGSNYF